MAVSWSSAQTRGTSSVRAEPSKTSTAGPAQQDTCRSPYPAGGRVRTTPGGGRGPVRAGTQGAVRRTSTTEGELPRMARLVGVDLPRDKRLEVALTYVYGIGRTRALETLQATGVSGDVRVHDLGDDDLVRLRDWIEASYKVEGDLRREVQADIRRKVEIGCYQGIRHRRGLPVHGQRTPTNARTRKGKKKTVAGRKKGGKKQAAGPRTDHLPEKRSRMPPK